MAADTEDIVKVASGTLIEMTGLVEVLREAGITGRVVGDDLATGLGSTLMGSVEVWVLEHEAARAQAILDAGAPLLMPPHGKFPHPHSDPKPDPSKGPHRGPEPYRPNH